MARSNYENGERVRPLRTFGRTGGRPLSARRAELVDTLLPDISVQLPEEGALDPAAMFGPELDQVWLEIGFGGGEHLAGQADRHRRTGFIGAEPFAEGVAKLLSEVESRALTNVRIHADDGRTVVAALSPESIDRVFILFPDPWPKVRHRKRRLIQPKLLEDLARIMKPGGSVRFATDIADYANEALARFNADQRFAWNAECADDWRSSPLDHLTTRYQSKQLGDCAPVFLDFIRSDQVDA